MAKQVEPYKCTLTLSNEILTLAADASYQIGRLSVLSEHGQEEEELASCVKYALMDEGILLTPSQYRGLKLGEDLEKVPEASGLLKLYKKYTRGEAITEKTLREYEEALFPNGVPVRMSRRVEGFPYPIPMHTRVPSLMDGLLRFGASKKVHPLSRAVLFYFMIYALAPYSRLNGPLAKLLFKAMLSTYSKDLAALPLEEMIHHRKKEVDAAYEKAVNEGDVAPFLSYMLRLIALAVTKKGKEAVRQENGSTPLVDKLIALMEEGRFYSAQELCDLLKLKSRLGLSKNYLRPGLASKKLLMSNPLTPTDRNQRYRKA